MQEDDVLPNDGTYFMPREPADQALERKKEQAIVLEGINFLKDMIGRLQDRIDFYEANSSIPDDVRVNEKEFMAIHNSYSLTAKTLKSEKEFLQSIVDSYKR